MDPKARHKADDALAILGVTAETLTEARRRDLDERELSDVLPGAFAERELDRLRSAFDRACEAEGIPPRGTRHPKRLIETDPAFARFLIDPRVLAAVVQVLGRPFRAGAVGRDPLPGFGQQGLHADWPETGSSSLYHVVTAIGMLDAFTPENGATRLVPGSHRLRRPPPKSFADPSSRHPDQVVVTAPAGSVLVFNGHLWHGGTRNTSGDHRRAVQVSFQARDLSLAVDPGPPPDGLSPAARVLLGFDPD